MHLKLKLESVNRKDCCHVELNKGDFSYFGFTLVDGVNGEIGPIIKKIKGRKFVERCHTVAENDVILALNGTDVIGRSHEDVQRMIRESGHKLDLKLLYETREVALSGPSLSCVRVRRTKRLLRKANGTFGFVLRWKSCEVAEYPVVSRIVPEGPAVTDNCLQDGDLLLKIGDVSLSWLSQAQVASLLLDITEAVFTFEYSVKERDLSSFSGKTIDLEIDLPTNYDLGLGFASSYAFGPVSISQIRRGSIVERCGIFKKGDVIATINGISTDHLGASQVLLLLRSSRKVRKISFLSSERKETNVNELHKECFGCKKTSRLCSENFKDYEGKEKQHLNTPTCSGSSLSLEWESGSLKNACFGGQVKAIRKFHDASEHLTRLKKSLSLLVRDAFDTKASDAFCDPDHCTVCEKTHCAVKLCASCLSRLNVGCVHALDALKNVIFHFIKGSINFDSHSSFVENKTSQDQEVNGKDSVSGGLIHSLTDTLPEMFAGKETESFHDLARKVAKADSSCGRCRGEIELASLATQKLLLLVSLNDPTRESQALVDQLVYCLLETDLPSDGDDGHPSSNAEDGDGEESVTESEHAMASIAAATGNFAVASSNDDDVDEFRSAQAEDGFVDVDLDSSPVDNNGGSSSSHRVQVDLGHNSAFYRLMADVGSVVGSGSRLDDDRSTTRGTRLVRELDETVMANSNGSVLNEMEAAENVNLKTPSPTEPGEPTSNVSGKKYRDKSLLNIPAKIWSSLDSFLGSKRTPNGQTKPNVGAKAGGSRDFLDVPMRSFVNPLRQKSADHSDASEDDKKNSNRESSLTSTNDLSISPGKSRYHAETVEVKMTNDGDGFGFVLGFCSHNVSSRRPVPIITVIKPKSPAHRSGVLSVDDRVLAINSQSIAGLSLDKLEGLKRRVSKSCSVSLLVEFDVADSEPQFGVFDVVVEKTLKVGLLFEDMKRGRPMLVQGLVKGSAGHRSGQLFPGDEVLFLKCVRNEEFNPLTCDYDRKEFVRITVRRERRQGAEPIPSKPSPTDPSVSGPSSSRAAGPSFVLKRRQVRHAGGRGPGTVVLDIELTLFRDPSSWDFGFLVGENPLTGRAYVTDVKPGGPAGASGAVQKMDRIIEVNGVTVGKSEENSVLSLLAQANDKVDLLIRRICLLENAPTASQHQKYRLPPFL